MPDELPEPEMPVEEPYTEDEMPEEEIQEDDILEGAGPIPSDWDIPEEILEEELSEEELLKEEVPEEYPEPDVEIEAEEKPDRGNEIPTAVTSEEEDQPITKLREAYESGKISKELYEKNLKTFK